jgi:hypothetical protein
MIVPLPVAAQATIDHDPLVPYYQRLFSHLDWSVLPQRDPDHPWPGPKPHPLSAYLKALLIKVFEGKRSMAALHRFLLAHPRLVLAIGLRPVFDPAQPSGLDLRRTLPSERWLRRHQQQDAPLIAALLAASVRTLPEHDPHLAAIVALDVTHHHAWVRQNNANQSVAHRFDRTHQPAGDPDCRLGAKHHPAAPKAQRREAFWGYLTGMTAAPMALGEVVIAVEVQPAARQDITLFPALAAQTEQVLGGPPPT